MILCLHKLIAIKIYILQLISVGKENIVIYICYSFEFNFHSGKYMSYVWFITWVIYLFNPNYFKAYCSLQDEENK